MDKNQIAELVVSETKKIQGDLGLRLAERLVQEMLVSQLRRHELFVELDRFVPLQKENETSEAGYFVDLDVGGQVLVELRSGGKVSEVYSRQLLTMLRLTDRPLGLLIHTDQAISEEQGVLQVWNTLEE